MSRTRKQPNILEKLVSQTGNSAEYAKERACYQAYCERVHRGRWKAARHHKLVCEKLEAVERGEIDRLMIFMPPRHGKSQSITETFPSWYLGRNPDKSVIEVSYGAHFAEKFGRLNRQKVEEYGEKIFGIHVSSDQASKTNWRIEGNTGGMISVGLGGSITGEGADLMILDDLIKNRAEAESEAYRRRLWDEWQDTLLTRLHPGGAVILIMTRWREDDLAGRILEQAAEDGEQWVVLSLPAVAEEGDIDPLGRLPGETLWPEHGFDSAWAARKKRDVGTRTWESLYQQQPTPAEGNIIKRVWWKFYQVMPAKFDMIFQSWDMTFKDGPANDFVVGQVWGKIEADRYLLDQRRERLNLPDTIRAVKQMKNKWPKTRAILIEDKANGPGVIDSLKKKISGIIPITPEGGKEARAWAVSPDIEAGNVFLPDPKISKWIEDFLNECTRFPGGKNDDQVDAMTQAINWSQNKKRRKWEVVRS